jgi:MarR family transcriptional regulator, lower aerobic nicotinate degradation pathway regulator
VPGQDLSSRPRGLLRWPSYALAQLHRTAKARVDAALSEKGLSARTYGVLVCLGEYGELSQQQVGDRVAIDRSDLVKLIDQLEALGRVERRPDLADRRRHVLSLTANGTRALREADQTLEGLTAEIFVNLSAAERQTLHRLTLKALGQRTQGSEPA